MVGERKLSYKSYACGNLLQYGLPFCMFVFKFGMVGGGFVPKKE